MRRVRSEQRSLFVPAPPAVVIPEMRLHDGRRLDELAAELPEWVLCISLWQPYAGLVTDGTKTIETRTWPFPYAGRGYAAGWLCIHAAKHVNAEAMKRIGAKAAPHRAPQGAILSLVHVAATRPLRPEDEDAACFYAEDRHAWVLDRRYPLAHPIAMVGPQKFKRIPRADVLRALTP